MVVAVPVLWLLMPWLMQIAFGPDYREHATTAARLVLSPRRCSSSGAGRSRSRSRSAGRGCGTSRSRVETASSCRCCSCFGAEWGATGGAAAMVVSTAVVLPALGRAARARARRARGDGGARELKVLVVSGIWPPDVGGPGEPRAGGGGVPARARARGRGRDHGRRRARARGVPGALGPALAAARRAARRRACGSSRRGRGAPTSSTRPACSAARRSARADRAHADRDEADRRPGVRARAPLGALARLARGVPDARAGADARRCALARDADVRRAAHVVMPSAYLRELALGWGVPAGRARPCCRTRRRRCRSCARATSCAPSSGSTGRRSRSPAG